jgi:hypothetical protein
MILARLLDVMYLDVKRYLRVSDLGQPFYRLPGFRRQD